MKIAGLVLAAGAGRRMGTPKALIRDAEGTSWAVRTARLLAAAGCSPVVVVIGAAANQVRAELSTEPVEVIEATDWPEGMSASLRTGLTTLSTTPPPPTATPATAGAPGTAATLATPGTAATPATPGTAAPPPSPTADTATSAAPGPAASTPTGPRSAGSTSAFGADAVVVVPVDVPGLTVDAVRRVVEEAGPEVLVRATYDGQPGHPVVIGRAHWEGVIASARGDEGARGYLRTHKVVLLECSDVSDGADVDTVDDLPPGHR